MSVATVKARLALIQKNRITGVKRSFAQGPNIINTGDMPLFINLTKPAQHNWEILGDDLDQETRLYLMRLYVLPAGNGIPGEAERLCEPFFDRVRDVFAGRPSLEGLAGVQQAVLLGDSGVTLMDYPVGNFAYWGIEFKLQVTEYIEVIYAANE
ncbi:MAG: hypothetical protein KJZ93_30925 [Caldilineaceae bacterium]|nr:hypothetical protein [Caldilineaceae bacterium]